MRRLLCFLALFAPLYAQPPRALTLPEAEALAVKNHPRVLIANLNALAAREGITQARAPLFPLLTGSVTGAGGLTPSVIGAGGLNVSTVDNRFASGLSASQLLMDFGRTHHLVETSKLRAEAQEDAVLTTRADILLQTDRAYFESLRAQDILRIAEQTVAARKLVADQVSELARSSLKSGLDVSFANVNLSEAKLLLVTAQNQQQAAFAQLSAALGEPNSTPYVLADVDIPLVLADAAEDYVREAMRNRPELAASRASQKAAAEFASAEKALLYPAVSAASSIGVIPSHDERLTGRYAAAGLTVSLPIFNGRQYASRLTEARLRAQAAVETVKDQENSIARDVRIAWLNANTALERIALTAELVSQAGQALDLAQARYDLGLSSIIELTQAQLNSTSAEIQNVSARHDFQSQLSTLKQQAGLLR